MTTSTRLLWWFVATGCGRFGFDPAAGTYFDGDSDGEQADTAPLDAGLSPSCAGLASICGPEGTSPCCESSFVPGGLFYRAYDVAPGGSDMSFPATVSDFRLDTYEVTVGRFRQFVNAGMGTQETPPPEGAGARPLNGKPGEGGWDPTWNTQLPASTVALVAAVKCSGMHQSWTDVPGASESLPMNCINWFEAFAFCAWDGGFLPTQAEWNYAAAGGSEQRAFPWSNPPSSTAIDCSYANYFTGSSYCVNPPTGAVARVGSYSPKGDGRYGSADLGGNVGEWTLDWSNLSYPMPCSDCADLGVATYRVFRGGFFSSDTSLLRTANRSRGMPDVRTEAFGLRCGRNP